MPAPRCFYLHGFASGPRSKKGVAFADHFAQRGLAIERLDLRVPSFEHLRLSKMIEVTQAAITGDAVLIGSSLGGLTASRVAERDPRVTRLVLLAPAFQLLARWQQLPEFADWQRTGWREVIDHTTNLPARVDYGFAEDAAAIDLGWPAIRVPTLILHGTRDTVVPIEHSRRFVEATPHVRLVELDDDHDLIRSLPTILAEAEAFLGTV
ncbi:MAG: YqiA/YcfP family alpha/beta fold hydrolase [Kofleriaceae bacterium]